MDVRLGTPQPKQIEFLTAKASYVAYGGARGGGKSWAVDYKAGLMALAYGGIRQLILRRTYPELEENHIRKMIVQWAGVAKYNDSKKTLTFPNGSVIRFGYCDSDGALPQYQGQEYDIIYFDEATTFTEYQFRQINACRRGVNDFPKRTYITCNPGGVGHEWVRRLFIDREYRDGENPDDYVFIQAGVRDNAALMASNPDYIKQLEALSPELRRAWLDGDWDAMNETAYFPEFRREIHVVEPFDIPSHWRRYRAFDYGLDALAVVWAALGENGECVIYRALKKPGLIVSEAAKEILSAESDGEEITNTYLPPDMKSRSRDSGKSQMELFVEGGIKGTVASNARVPGWMALKEWLKPIQRPDGEGQTARMRIFSTCTGLIKDLAALQHDAKNPTDAATEPHEVTHLPDALRYFAVMHQREKVIVPMTEEEKRAKALADIKKRAISGQRRARMV